MSKSLIEAGLDLISFSFDGYNKKSYESIRVKANFDKTLANIERLFELKKELKSKTPKTVMEIMEKLNKDTNTAFIFATHDPRVVSFARRVVQLRDGKIVHNGSGMLDSAD